MPGPSLSLPARLTDAASINESREPRFAIIAPERRGCEGDFYERAYIAAGDKTASDKINIVSYRTRKSGT